jgi:hypothetical protein
VKLEKEFSKDPLENDYHVVCENCQTPKFVQFWILYRLTFEPTFYHIPELSYFKLKKIELLKNWNSIHKFEFYVRGLIFFLKCSSFDAESEYHIQRLFLAFIFLKNSFFPLPIPKNPFYEHFGENFLETKRKSTLKNPYKLKKNLKRSAVPKIV